MEVDVTHKLDWKDKKILRELDRNSRQSYSTIAKKTGFSKNVVVYRINNLLEHGIIKSFISFIDIQRLGYTFYDVLFKLKHYAPEEEQKVIEQIKNMPEVGWFVTTRGEWRLIVCFMAKDPADFNISLEKVLKLLGDKIIRYDFFIVLHAYQLPYKMVLDAKDKLPTPTHLGLKNNLHLKDQDMKILESLSRDARIPKNEIAEKNDLTLEVVRHSIQKIEKSGLVQAYKPLLDVAKAGYRWTIMLIQFNHTSEKIKREFLDYLKNKREVFYLVTGVGNWSLMVEFHTKEVEAFSHIQDEINAKFEHLIANEATLRVVRENKCTFYPYRM